MGAKSKSCHRGHNAFILQGITKMSKGMQMRTHDEEVS